MQNGLFYKTLTASLVAAPLFYLPICSANGGPDDSVLKTREEQKLAIGLQLAPLTIGISVKYQPREKWAFQLAVTPDSGDTYLTLRGLRNLQNSTFWSSYYFAGIARGQSEVERYQYDTNGYTYLKNTETIVSTGLGIEWSWQAKNINRPPLYTSLEFGLGYKSHKYDDSSSESKTQLVLGWGLHYHF